MKPEEPPPSQKPKVVNIRDDKPAEDKVDPPTKPQPHGIEDRPSPESRPESNDIDTTDSGISEVVNDEILRAKIRRVAGEQPPSSTWQRLSANPLISVIIGFILTGLLGGLLTHFYSVRQKEIELQRAEEQRKSDRLYEGQRRESDRIREDQRRESERVLEDQRRESDRIYQERQKELEYLRGLQQKQVELLYDKRQRALEYQRSLQRGDLDYERAFATETNRIRVQKIGEVWEEIDRTESKVDSIAEQIGRGHDRPAAEIEQDIKSIRDLISGQGAIINKNRFWLGEEIYNQIREYLDIHGKYTVDRVLGKPENLLSEAKKKRGQAKRNILEIRRSMLSEPTTAPKQPRQQ